MVRLSGPKTARRRRRPYPARGRRLHATRRAPETFPAGSVRVPSAQPLGLLAAAMLEPEGTDSLLQWNFFPEILMRTEYIEGYAIAPLAERMLAADPALKTRIRGQARAPTPNSPRDPDARLGWFYERTPYYDERFLLYPVGRELKRLVDEPRDDVAIAAADLDLRARIEHQEAFAIGVRLDLPDEVEIDDGRAVDPLEPPRVEPLFEVLHRLAQDQRIVAGLDAHVIAGGVDPLDRVDLDAENLALVLDVDGLLEAVGGRALGRGVGQFLGRFGRMLGQRSPSAAPLPRRCASRTGAGAPGRASRPAGPRRPASSDNRPPAHRTRAAHGRRKR